MINVTVYENESVAIDTFDEAVARVGVNSEVTWLVEKDYEELDNKPKINGETLIGNKTSAQLNIKEDLTYTYTQAIPSDTWSITHNLNKFPSITIIDSANNIVVGDAQYIDANTVICTFSGQFSGKAFLN